MTRAARDSRVAHTQRAFCQDQTALVNRVLKPQSRSILGLMRLDFLSVFSHIKLPVDIVVCAKDAACVLPESVSRYFCLRLCG